MPRSFNSIHDVKVLPYAANPECFPLLTSGAYIHEYRHTSAHWQHSEVGLPMGANFFNSDAFDDSLDGSEQSIDSKVREKR